jgi:hypothetical protein
MGGHANILHIIAMETLSFLLVKHASAIEAASTSITTNTSLEIELRLGRRQENGAFISGLPLSVFERLYKTLAQDQDAIMVEPTSTLDCYVERAQKTLRYRFHDSKLVSIVYKQKVVQQHCQLLASRQEARLSVALEHSLSPQKEPFVAEAVTVRRHKNTRTYNYFGTNGLRIELSRIESEWLQPSKGTTVSYECELEFETRRVMREHNLRALVPWLEKLLERLVPTLELCSTIDLEAPREPREPREPIESVENRDAQLITSAMASGWLQSVPTSAALYETVSRRIFTLWSMAAPTQQLSDFVTKKRTFAGAMPVALRRSELAKLVQEACDYYVSEKSDGLRVMLYVSMHGIFFIERTLKIYEVLARGSYFFTLARPELLLDGELVVRQDVSNRLCFMAFELYALNGESLAETKLPDRLKRIALNVVAPLRRHLESTKDAQREPFDLLGKQFWPLSELDALLAHVKTANGKHFYSDARRYHFTDGFVFTPAHAERKGLFPYTNTRLYKLKQCSQNTVDLRLCFGSRRTVAASLCALASGTGTGTGTSSEEIECEVTTSDHFEPHDEQRLRTLAARSIVEVWYDGDSARWRLQGVREKTRPNHISVVIDTLASAQERLGIAELRQSLSARLMAKA